MKYCEWPDCPNDTPATHAVIFLKDSETWSRPMYFCTRHFRDYQAEEPKL